MMQKAILSHDATGKRHELRVVDHPAGLVSISDDDWVRILEPRAAIGLAVELILAAEDQVGGGQVVGLFSSRF